MEKMTLTKTRQQTKTAENVNAGIDSISKSSIAIMGSFSALIGVWAIVSLVSAMVASGGPLAWFLAGFGLSAVCNFLRNILQRFTPPEELVFSGGEQRHCQRHEKGPVWYVADWPQSSPIISIYLYRVHRQIRLS